MPPIINSLLFFRFASTNLDTVIFEDDGHFTIEEALGVVNILLQATGNEQQLLRTPFVDAARAQVNGTHQDLVVGFADLFEVGGLKYGLDFEDGLTGGERDADGRARLTIGQVDKLADGRVAHGQDAVAHVGQFGRTDADRNHGAAEAVDHHDVAHVEQTLGDDEEAGHDVLDEGSDAQADDQGDDAQACQDGGGVDAERIEDQARQDDEHHVFDQVAEQVDDGFAHSLGQLIVRAQETEDGAQQGTRQNDQDGVAQEASIVQGVILGIEVEALDKGVVLGQEEAAEALNGDIGGTDQAQDDPHDNLLDGHFLLFGLALRLYAVFCLDAIHIRFVDAQILLTHIYILLYFSLSAFFIVLRPMGDGCFGSQLAQNAISPLAPHGAWFRRRWFARGRQSRSRPFGASRRARPGRGARPPRRPQAQIP